MAVEIDSIDDDEDIVKPRWYLPLHIVELRGKTRVCHDARAANDGICLNDLLVGGPNLMNSLMDILMRFRQWKIAFMCDIKAFFHQIRVHPDDADLFRFFWFKDRSLRLAILNLFLSHVFGSLSSSFVTGFTVRHHAEVIRPYYPSNVYNFIHHGFYVDNGSGGGDTVDEALELKTGVKSAMGDGGFQLVKWKSISSWKEILTSLFPSQISKTTTPDVRRAHVRRADGRIVTRDRTTIVRLEMDS